MSTQFWSTDPLQSKQVVSYDADLTHSKVFGSHRCIVRPDINTNASSCHYVASFDDFFC